MRWLAAWFERWLSAWFGPLYQWRDRWLLPLLERGEAGGPAAPSPVTLREVLWLCAPALLLGAILRGYMIYILPDSYYGSDSNSFFSFAYHLWENGRFVYSEKRRYLYPIFLALFAKLPGGASLWVAPVQHLGGLVTIVALGWIGAHLLPMRRVFVPVFAIILAIWPQMLWYEHEIIAEPLMLLGGALAMAMFFPLSRLAREPQRVFYALLWAAVMIGMKPAGKPLYGIWVIAIGLLGVAIWKWPFRTWCILGLGCFMTFAGGSGRQGSWLLLSSTLPLVPEIPQGNRLDPYRAELVPMILDARSHGEAYPWSQKFYKKALTTNRIENIGPHWKDLRERNAELSLTEVYGGLAKEGLQAHPLEWLRLTMAKAALAASDGSWANRLDSLSFRQDQFKANQNRGNLEQMYFFFGVENAAELNVRMERIGSRQFPFLQPYRELFDSFRWAGTGGAEQKLSAVFGHWVVYVLAGGLLAILLQPRRWLAWAVIGGPMVFYLFAVFSVGDRVSRYWFPIEWIGLLLVLMVPALLLETICRCFGGRKARKMPSGADRIEAAS